VKEGKKDKRVLPSSKRHQKTHTIPSVSRKGQEWVRREKKGSTAFKKKNMEGGGNRPKLLEAQRKG